MLLLPDGRIAVVACLDKGVLMPRDCRVPIIDNIQAEFDGDRAKLLWPVSLDGRKAQSETYKVVAIMTKNEYEAATTPK